MDLGEEKEKREREGGGGGSYQCLMPNQLAQLSPGEERARETKR